MEAVESKHSVNKEKSFSVNLNSLRRCCCWVMFFTGIHFYSQPTICLVCRAAQRYGATAKEYLPHHAISHVWGASHGLFLPDDNTFARYFSKSHEIWGVYVSPKGGISHHSSRSFRKILKGSDERTSALGC